LIEVTLSGGSLGTDLPVYKIEPGCLYILHAPAGVTESQLGQLKEVFAQDKQVLNPPATLLIMSRDFNLTKAPDDYIEQQYKKYKELMEKRGGTP
jgi:hypothetical protein